MKLMRVAEWRSVGVPGSSSWPSWISSMGTYAASAAGAAGAAATARISSGATLADRSHTPATPHIKASNAASASSPRAARCAPDFFGIRRGANASGVFTRDATRRAVRGTALRQGSSSTATHPSAARPRHPLHGAASQVSKTRVPVFCSPEKGGAVLLMDGAVCRMGAEEVQGLLADRAR